MDKSTFASDSSSSSRHFRFSKMFSRFLRSMFLGTIKIFVAFLLLALGWCIVRYKMRLRRVEALKVLSKYVHVI